MSAGSLLKYVMMNDISEVQKFEVNMEFSSIHLKNFLDNFSVLESVDKILSRYL